MAEVFLFGFLSGAPGILVGYIIGWLIKKHNKQLIVTDNSSFCSGFQEFSSGLMMATVTFHLLPVAIDIGGFIHACTGLLIGGVGSVFIWGKGYQQQSDGRFRFCMLIPHIPEGLAVGMAFVNHIELAIALFAGFLIRHTAQGILFCGTWNKKLGEIFLLALSCGVFTGLFAMLGAALGNISPGCNSFSFGFCAGCLLHVLSAELSRQEKESSKSRICEIMYIFGLITGILLK